MLVVPYMGEAGQRVCEERDWRGLIAQATPIFEREASEFS